MSNLDDFTAATIEALYFTDTGDSEQPPSTAILSEETRLDIEADCRSWWRIHGAFVMACEGKMNLPEDCGVAAMAGHDFWLTRNGHGAGFWDGDWDSTPYAEMFTKAAKSYGPFETYLGDNGEICS